MKTVLFNVALTNEERERRLSSFTSAVLGIAPILSNLKTRSRMDQASPRDYSSPRLLSQFSVHRHGYNALSSQGRTPTIRPRPV
jgi:hypothetical protein